MHLAAVLGLSIAGSILGFILPGGHLLGVIAALAPLVALHGAQRAGKVTLIISAVCALLLLACLYGVLVLVYLNSLGQGRV